MERLLARSKSLKIRRDVEEHHQGLPSIMDQVPENGASPHGAILQSPSLTSLQIATNSFDPNLPRPKTANAAAPARRNWSELTATGSPIEITADEDTFLFPTPVSRKVPSPILSSAVKPAEMESTDDVVNIGVAIGSPSQTSYFSPPMSSSRLAPPSQQDVTTPRTPPMRSNTTRETRTEDMDGARPKLSRWKSLGGLFGRKRFASPPISRQGSRDALELKKREVAELRGEIAVQTTINSTVTSPYSPRHLRKSKKSVKGRSPLLRSNLWDSDVPSGASPPPSQFAPLLNVDIPQVRMERYSVMFSELLPQRATRSSSLLARRQAMGDRLKPPGGPLKVRCRVDFDTP